MTYSTEVNKVSRLDKDLYRITETESVNRYLLIGREKALLIDAGWGYEDIWPILRSITDLPIILAVTHGDPDHALGACYFDKFWIHCLDYGKLIMADRNTDDKRNMLKYRFHKVPELKQWIDEETYVNLSLERSSRPSFLNNGDILDLGGKHVEVIHTPGHSWGHVMFLEKETGRLYSGDQLTGRHNIWYFASTDEQAPFYVAYDSMKKLRSRESEFQEIYPAHGECPIGKECLDQYLECFEHEFEEHYLEDTPFVSPIGMGYQHVYKNVNIIYSDERLSEFLGYRVVRKEDGISSK